MMPLRLIDVLPDFGAPPPARSVPLREVHAHVPTPVDMSAVIATAVAEAEAALMSRMSAEQDARLAAERELHSAELEAAARRFGTEAGDIVRGRLAALEEELGARTASVVGRVLGTMMSDTLRARSIEALARILVDAVRDPDTPRLEVKGPLSMYEELAKALGGRIANVAFVEAEGFDLSASVDETVFETRIGEWSRTISEILG